MYEKVNPEQKMNLVLGSRLRTIGCVDSQVSGPFCKEVGAFNAEEIKQIQDICAQARSRAQKEYATAKSLLPPRSKG